MRKSYLTILALLLVFGLSATTYAQQRDPNGGYGGRYGQVGGQGSGSPNVFDNQDGLGQYGTGGGVINRTDSNGGYGGYYPGRGPGSPCIGCGGGYHTPVIPCNGNGCGGPPVNNVNVNNTYNNKFYRPFLQEVELQGTGTGFGILRDYFAVKFQTSGQRKLQREKAETDKQLAMMQMQMMMQMSQSQQRDTYREYRSERYERDDRRSAEPQERSMDVHVSNNCQFTVQLEVNGEIIKTLGSRHAVSISVPSGGQLTVLRMDGSVLRQYSHPGSEVVIQ